MRKNNGVERGLVGNKNNKKMIEIEEEEGEAGDMLGGGRLCGKELGWEIAWWEENWVKGKLWGEASWGGGERLGEKKGGKLIVDVFC